MPALYPTFNWKGLKERYSSFKHLIMKMIHEYDFNNGVQIEQSLIDKWTKQSLEYFKKNPNEHTCITRTGNGLVIAIKERDYEIRVFQITNGYNLQEYKID